MLYIFGTKGKAIKGKIVGDEPCSHCGKTPQVVTPIVKYFHIFWIPVVLYKKMIVLTCPHCKKQSSEKELGPSKVKEFKEVAFNEVSTYQYFTGLAIFIAAAIISSFI